MLEPGQAGYDLVRIVSNRASSERSHLSPGRLAPADLKKDANGFALPITLRLLVGSGQVRFDQPGNCVIVVVPALIGKTLPVKGILSKGDAGMDRTTRRRSLGRG